MITKIGNLEEFKVKSSDGKTRIKIKFNCQSCGKSCESHKYNLTNNSSFFCRSCNNKLTGKNKRGIPSKKKGREQPKRENAAKWKGGKYINKAGYVMILVKSGSINRKSGWENYRPEHIVKIEEKIGRKLIKGECVHHKDGNRQNNNIDNLSLIKTHQHHRKTHMSLQRIGYELYKRGIICFNDKTGEYEIDTEITNPKFDFGPFA